MVWPTKACLELSPSKTRRKVGAGAALRWAALALLGVTAVVVVSGRHILEAALPYAIVETSRLLPATKYRWTTPAGYGLSAEPWTIQTAPDVQIVGWLIRTPLPAKGTVVLLHGHNSCKESMLSLACLLAQHGFNSVAYDARGCGASTGRYCTYGYYEKEDCSRCLDVLTARYGTALGPLSLFGNSLGGATAIQILAQDRRFRCGIVECTFATLPEAVRDYERRFLGTVFERETRAALQKAGNMARFPPDRVSPWEAAAHVPCPVMVVHGTADRNIPCEEGRRVFARLVSPRSRWLPIPGATHHDLWEIGQSGYRDAVLNFLETEAH